MARARDAREPAVAGVADHAGWAVLMTIARHGRLLDRRRVELLGGGLPALPHHHEAQGLPAAQAIALVERVRASAVTHAEGALEALAASVPATIVGVALRRCPPLPDGIVELIASYRAQCVADTVMYREAIAGAARARGWEVHWYEAKSVFAQAARALGRSGIDDLLAKTSAKIGPPWQKDQRMAMAAAIAALDGTRA